MAGLAGAITVWPVRAEERGKVYRLAIVSPATPVTEMSETGSSPYRAFLSELRHSGYAEGQNLQIRRYSGEDWGEYRGDVRITERFAGLAKEVVHSEPDVIFVEERILAHQVRAVTGAIPIVAVVPDPIVDGLVRSLAHPGGNITGSTVTAGAGIWGKRLELLRELVPSVSKVGYLAPYSLSKTPYTQAIREAAHKLNVTRIPPLLEPRSARCSIVRHLPQ
jgi:ABC transporter substrate binding protein